MRVTGAALLLMPLLLRRDQLGALRAHWWPILAVGITNSALPFLFFSCAGLLLTAGLSAIFNASSPLFGALIAGLWLKDRLTPVRVLGLVIGFVGALWLAWDKASFKPGGTGWALLACLAGPLCYGASASYTKRHLAGVPPLAVAAGSPLGAALVLALPAVLGWPATAPSTRSWAAAAMLPVLCTGLAYLLYFRLIAHVGPAHAIAVTFLVPACAVLWGALLLGERVTAAKLVGSAVILLGSSLATGLLGLPRRPARP